MEGSAWEVGESEALGLDATGAHFPQLRLACRSEEIIEPDDLFESLIG